MRGMEGGRVRVSITRGSRREGRGVGPEGEGELEEMRDGRKGEGERGAWRK
jgi:hypothetical protein